MRTQAFIIKKQHANEYDQHITCYTQELGKLTAVAKSASKSHSVQGMQLNLMNLVEFELVSGRGMPIITGAQTVRGHRNIKTDLASLGVGYFFLEAVSRIVFDYERDDGLWNFMADLFDELDRLPESETIMPLFRHKQKELLNVMGYLPALSAGQADGERGVPEPALAYMQTNSSLHSPADAIFEQIAQSRFASLKFIYGILSRDNVIS
ncbi:MAG: DNA repair protein RecO [Candidatus Yanofskybacteria bacterium]|nr:DNA repair protein RecO [Candidatus Yanofskybacteria bacterium]